MADSRTAAREAGGGRFAPLTLVPGHAPRPRRANSALQQLSIPIGLGFVASTCRREYARRSRAGVLAGGRLPAVDAELAGGKTSPQREPEGRIAGIACRGPWTRTFPNFNSRSIWPKGG
jgi:hypothetical protein